MRVAEIFSAVFVLGCGFFSACGWASPSRERSAQDIYEFVDEELRDERVMALFTIATSIYNHDELKKLVRTVKADPRPVLLRKVAEFLVEKGINWPLEQLAIFYTRGIFQQLNAAAQEVVAKFKIKSYSKEYPEVSQDFKQIFQDKEKFFATVLTAIRTRDDKAYDTLELLLTIGGDFLSEEMLKFLVNSSTQEERVFLLALLEHEQLLTAEFQAALQTHTKASVDFVLDDVAFKKQHPRNDNRLMFSFTNGKKTLRVPIADPDHGRVGMDAHKLEKYTSNLVTAIEDSALIISEVLKEKVAEALQSPEAYFPKIAEAIRLHDFAFLLPLIFHGKEFLNKPEIVGLLELSAEARNPFFVQILLGDDLQEFSYLFTDLTPKACSYILAVVRSEDAAEQIVGAYVGENGDGQDPNDKREWDEMVKEAKTALHGFLMDESKFPSQLHDLDVLIHHLRGKIAQKAIRPFKAKQIVATCNAWDGRLRQHGLTPSMRAGAGR